MVLVGRDLNELGMLTGPRPPGNGQPELQLTSGGGGQGKPGRQVGIGTRVVGQIVASASTWLKVAEAISTGAAKPAGIIAQH